MPIDGKEPRWLKSLELRNFQKHEHTELEFDPGVNIIRGRNNAGKTSIARAIRLLVYNQPRMGVNDDLIRWGKDSCLIRMEMSDGSWVIREKGEGVNRYVVDSPLIHGRRVELNGFGTAVPPEVTRALGFGPLTLAKTSGLELNIAAQGEAAFMLSETSPEIARWMYALTSLDDIREAIDSLTKDHRAHGRSISGHEKRIEELNERIEALAPLDAQDAQLTEIQAAVENLDDSMEQLNLLETLLSDMVELKNRAVPIKKRRQKLDLILETLSDEAIEELEETRQAIEVLVEADEKLDALRPRASTLHTKITANLKMSKIPLDEIEEQAENLRQLSTLADQIAEKDVAIAKMRRSHDGNVVVHKLMVEEFEELKSEVFEREEGDAACPLCGHAIDEDEMDHILEAHGDE